MRINPFEYKKTRKVVQKFQGISVDLTVQEAADLQALVINTSGDTKDEFLFKLYKALDGFIEAQPIKPRARIKAPYVVIENLE